MAVRRGSRNGGFFHPDSLLRLIFVLLGCYATLSASLPAPVPNPDFVEDLNLDKVHTIEHDGKKYEMSTRDIILISAAAILAFFIIVCLIGYCFCECVKSLICCICCCDC